MNLRDTFRAAVRDEWDGIERITKDLRPADFFTLLNALLGLMSIVAAEVGLLKVAFALVLVAVIADGLDGFVARLGGGGGPLGGTLDSLADTVSFVAAPALIAAVHLDAGPDRLRDALVLAPLAFYTFCGLLRLARFESLRETKPRRYFSGLASPAAALTLLSVVFVGLPPAWVLLVAFLLGLLMVSRIRYPKLRGWLGVVATVMILGVLATAPLPDWQVRATWALLGIMALYVAIGPYYVLTRIGPTPDPRVAA